MYLKKNHIFTHVYYHGVECFDFSMTMSTQLKITARVATNETSEINSFASLRARVNFYQIPNLHVCGVLVNFNFSRKKNFFDFEQTGDCQMQDQVLGTN